MSNDLIWQLVRNNNSFLVKRNGVSLSREPGNLLNKHSFKYSGLLKKTVGVSQVGTSVEISTKIARKTRKPASSIEKSKHYKSVRSLAPGIKKNLEFYRPDLTDAVLGRISRYQYTKRTIKPATARKPRGNKA